MDTFTNRLSEYLDDEVSAGERREIEAHLARCEACRGVLDDLRDVVERARALDPRPPAADLWPAIAARTARSGPRRLTFTVPQLAAAGILLAVLSGALTRAVVTRQTRPAEQARSATPPVAASAEARAPSNAAPIAVAPVRLADSQYDAAVADLERALDKGRSRLDPATVAAVEQSLRTIDQALAQAQQALAEDPANTYLSSHVVETRRRKLDLLRRAAALTMN